MQKIYIFYSSINGPFFSLVVEIAFSQIKRTISCLSLIKLFKKYRVPRMIGN